MKPRPRVPRRACDRRPPCDSIPASAAVVIQHDVTRPCRLEKCIAPIILAGLIKLGRSEVYSKVLPIRGFQPKSLVGPICPPRMHAASSPTLARDRFFFGREPE